MKIQTEYPRPTIRLSGWSAGRRSPSPPAIGFTENHPYGRTRSRGGRRPTHGYGSRSLAGRIGVRAAGIAAAAVLFIGLIDNLTPGGAQFNPGPATAATTSGR